MPSIIGLTGTLGAGKGAVVAYLTQHRGFAHFSVRDYLTTIIERRGLPVNRDSMVTVANELREQHSPSYLAEALLHEARAKPDVGDFIIESIRTEGEVVALRALAPDSFKLFAVDAPVALRYERIRGRASATDDVSLATFTANEERELHSSDPTKQNLSRCIELSDATFTNDGTLEQLWAQIDAAVPAPSPARTTLGATPAAPSPGE